MSRLWGKDSRHHRKAVRKERSEGWRLFRLWLKTHRRWIITRALGMVGLFAVWGGLLLVANADGWSGGQLILAGVVCSIAWMYLYVSEVRDPR